MENTCHDLLWHTMYLQAMLSIMEAPCQRHDILDQPFQQRKVRASAWFSGQSVESTFSRVVLLLREGRDQFCKTADRKDPRESITSTIFGHACAAA